MGLFDSIKQGEVKGKVAREGFSPKGSGQVLCRLDSTSLWQKKNNAGKVIPGQRRYKIIFEIVGFDKDADLSVNTNQGKDAFKAPRYRVAELGDKISLLTCEESKGFQEYGDAVRFALYAAACGAIRVEDGTASTPDGNTDEAAVDAATDAWYTDSSAMKGVWFKGNFTYRPNKEEGKDGFTSFDAEPLSDEDISEMIAVLSGAREDGLSDEAQEAAYNTFCEANRISDADTARNYLQRIGDDEAEKAAQALDFVLAQRP